ncbi:hypothetical protein [Streptomyces sp. NBC_00272]|uniref:hypothetical protein n=1 Tax=Streptomyces sp. NBC_00272 TaxID=2975698 RepID=UPI002E2B5255|nr:hypothetical protein [Streptomyces sp. NBC_00272]
MTASRIVAAYIDKLLTDVRARESSLESRAATVLTTTLTLGAAQATVLGLLAIWKVSVPPFPRVVIVAAGVAPLAGCVCSLIAGAPRRRQEVDPASLGRLIGDEPWTDAEESAAKEVARAQLQTLVVAQSVADR